MPRAGRATWLVATAAAALALAACRPVDGPGRVTVLAASSVVDLVEALAAEAGVEVAVSGAGTPQLVAQVLANGIDGIDLLLLADEAAARGLAADVAGVPMPRPWVSTALVLVASDPDVAVRGFAAIVDDDGLDWVLAEAGVPLGDATASVLADDLERILPRVVSLESSALDVLGKLSSGAVDVGVVYAANAAPAVARGALSVVRELPVRVVTHAQALTPAGADLEAILQADVDGLRTRGFEPSA